LGEEWKSFGDRLAIEASTVDGQPFGCAKLQDAVPMYVMGVNHENYKSSDTVVRSPWEWDGDFRSENMRRTFTNKTFGAKRIP